MITFAAGDLLQADAEALVNAVNCVGVMGKGIARQFKRLYPENCRAYATACARGEVTVGTMFVTETGQLDGARYVINFPTKRHWREPSQLSYIDAGLVDLVRVLRDEGIRSVAVPALGVGNGGLDWASVEPRLLQALQQLPDVHVIIYPPHAGSGNRSHERLPRNRASPVRAEAHTDRWPQLDSQAPITKADREAILGYDPNTGV
jgi:O-acetyl-ADP-ribose deacetylase (regulator of RNase III)